MEKLRATKYDTSDLDLIEEAIKLKRQQIEN